MRRNERNKSRPFFKEMKLDMLKANPVPLCHLDVFDFTLMLFPNLPMAPPFQVFHKFHGYKCG